MHVERCATAPRDETAWSDIIKLRHDALGGRAASASRRAVHGSRQGSAVSPARSGRRCTGRRPRSCRRVSAERSASKSVTPCVPRYGSPTRKGHLTGAPLLLAHDLCCVSSAPPRVGVSGSLYRRSRSRTPITVAVMAPITVAAPAAPATMSADFLHHRLIEDGGRPINHDAVGRGGRSPASAATMDEIMNVMRSIGRIAYRRSSRSEARLQGHITCDLLHSRYTTRCRITVNLYPDAR
jgi:hypothetical protein